MIDCLVEANGHVCRVMADDEEEMKGYFGDFDVLGKRKDIYKKNLIAFYSDVSFINNPFADEDPDAILVLVDGRCIFLYEVEN